MPHHPDAAVAELAGRAARVIRAGIFDALDSAGAQGLRHADAHRVILMVGGHDFRRGRAAGFKHRAVADDFQEAAWVEHAAHQHFQLQFRGRGRRVPGHRPPRHKPLPLGAERTDARLHAVRCHQRFVKHKQRWNLLLVSLQLIERRARGGRLISRILQLQHRQRQAVDEQHDVRAAGVTVLGDGELTHRQVVVVVGVVEIGQAKRAVPACAVLQLILDLHAVHQQAVKRAVLLDQRRAVGRMRDLIKRGLFQVVFSHRRTHCSSQPVGKTATHRHRCHSGASSSCRIASSMLGLSKRQLCPFLSRSPFTITIFCS